MLCPEIAQNVQLRVLPPQVYDKESNQIYYDMGNFDNVFTKNTEDGIRKVQKTTMQRKRVLMPR